jgi:hypothetical protein
MNIKTEYEGNFNTLKSIIEEMDRDKSIKGIMVYTCDLNNFTEDMFFPILNKCKTSIFGGVFPSILSNGQKYDKGSIVIGFKSNVKSQIVHDIHHSNIEDELSNFNGHLDEGKTFLINIDGLSEGVELFKEELFYTLGLSKNYIGGGAGSISFERKPCVICNEGLLKDAAVVSLIDVDSGVGVAHGWDNISEPMKVTKSEGNNIISLNWEPAFSVYQEAIKKLSGHHINEDNFFEIAKAYPFGISKIGNEMIVRDPICVIDRGTLLCVGAIPQNSFVYLLNGNEESLIKGAEQAKINAINGFTNITGRAISENTVTLFIDCISRALFLKDDYHKELEVLGNEAVYGALTLGEIANMGKAYLELYNKTSVVGMLEE